MSAWPDPNASRAEVEAFERAALARANAKATEPAHEAPEVSNGPSLVCNACEVIRVGPGAPVCRKCLAACPELAGK